MRNRLCMDLWNSFSPVPYINDEPDAINGTRGKFVEVLVNGKYQGLYCLSEKIDRKQLKLKKDYEDGGVLFKCTGSTIGLVILRVIAQNSLHL